MNKDENQKAIQKMHEITPLPTMDKHTYKASEVLALIEKDRETCEVWYAQYIRRITIQK